MLPESEAHANPMFRQTLNQFVLTLILLGILHFSYVLIMHSAGSWFNSLLPFIIDCTILLAVMSIMLIFKWLVLKLPFGGSPFLSSLPSTLTFFLLGFGTLAMLAYSAYTGDRFNISLAGYFVSNAGDLLGPVIAETGYMPLLAGIALAAVSGIALHRVHLLNNQHLALIFLWSTLGLLLAKAYAGHGDPRMYAFFSPPARTILPGIEKDQSQPPPWFQSFYLTMFGWDHAAYRQEEKAGPDTQYSIPFYQGQSGNRPNILLLTLESVRASATSPYNSSREILYLTPNLHQLSRSGVLVEHAYSTVPHTSKALVGIFCGQFPRKEMEITEAESNGLPVPCMPRLLANAGYQTAFFQSALGTFENRQGLTENMGFQETYAQEQLPSQAYKKFSYIGMDDYVMLDPAIAWMTRQKKMGKPFFAGMLTVVTHHPYATPESKRIISAEASYPDEAFSAYLSAVSYTDRFIGDLVRRMKQTGLMENTVVIITGDHGEAFAEHGLAACRT